ncbi:MAG TPA: hypothetical protein VND98_04985 [Solirubrobacterales bacterium]|nr:hypothetical protein [Solirubrobacterales bacterium]
MFLSASPALALTATTTRAARSAASATLNGIVNPEGVSLTECFFEWGETAAPYEHTVQCAEGLGTYPGELGTGTAAESVNANISGLTLGHRYHYRLIAANPAEIKTGLDQTFTAGASHTFSEAFTGPAAAPLSTPTAVAVDNSTGDLYVSNTPVNEQQRIEVNATGGTFTVSFNGKTSYPIPFDAEGNPNVLFSALAPLIEPPGNPGAFRVLGNFTIEFIGLRGGAAQPLMTADGSHLTGRSPSVQITTVQPAHSIADVEKFSPSGQFLLIFGREVNKGKVEEAEAGKPVTEAEQNLCVAGEECQPGSVGISPGSFTDPAYLAVDNSGGPSTGDVYVGDHVTGEGSGDVQKFDSSGNLLASWGNGGLLDGTSSTNGYNFAGNIYGPGLTGVAVDPNGNLFVYSGGRYFEFDPNGSFLTNFTSPQEDPGLTPGSPESFYVVGSLSGSAIDPLTLDRFSVGVEVEHFPPSCAFMNSPCVPIDTFGAGHLSEPRGLALNASTGTVYVADAGHQRIAVFDAVPYLPDVSASAEPKTPTEEGLEGEVDPAGAPEVTSCSFEYGKEPGSYGEGSAPCQGFAPFSTPTHLEGAFTGLLYGTTYHYRLQVEDADGSAASYDREFTTLPEAPQIEAERATAVHGDFARIAARINPGGGEATYHTHYRVQYVTQQHFEEEEFEGAEESPSADAGSARTFQAVEAQLTGLTPNTTYHYRLLAENASSPPAGTPGPAHTFTTLPFLQHVNDPCPNAHVRQQTSAALLLDCRAYELVSSPHAGGYDVESSLVPGQAPFASYPEAPGRVLYGIHNGGIPGIGEPTNRGLDPYLATRGPEGWTTEYVGIPAGHARTPSNIPFSSTLLEASAGLDTFAFGGEGICSPCFADHSTGIPLHLSGGGLVQGMAGSETPGLGAEPAGYVAKHLSADGRHLIFGSTEKFEPDANSGEISIYDRNLATGETHVVSKATGGGNLACVINCQTDGIGALDVSSDGSQVLIGQLVSEVGKAKYWRLYMNAGDSSETTEVTPGASEGVLFDGMTADGSKVFFSSEEHLTGQDEEHSGAALYMWAQATDSLTLISKGPTEVPGAPGDTGSCEPVENSAHQHWNTVGSEENCGIVAIGGGGGVASADGSVYFLSPELLAGTEEPEDGTRNAPNLYVVRPGDGYLPHFVTTLESALTKPHPPKLRRAFDHDFGAFARATALAVDHSSGDFYILDAGANRVEKFDSSGHLVESWAAAGKLTGSSAEGAGELENGSTEIKSVTTSEGAFSAGQEISGTGIPSGTTIQAVSPGSLEISQPAEASATGVALSAHQSFSESFFGVISPTSLAVDPSNGDLYVPDIEHNVVDKFSPSGVYLGQVEVSSPTGVAIDPANGHLYVSGLFGSVSVFDPSGSPLPGFSSGLLRSGIAVDSAGTIYLTRLAPLVGEFGTDVYGPSGESKGVLDSEPSQSVTVEPVTGDVYVDEGEEIARYDSSGKRIETLDKPGHLSGSVGVAIDPEGNLYATDEAGTKVAIFKASLAPDPRTDNPVVIDSVTEPEARHTADFQTTPDGRFAAFPSTVALAGHEEETAGLTEVYRYDAEAEALACASCTPTGIPSASGASLAQNGQSLASDGALFFDTSDQLAAADTDERQDAYEWEPKGTGNCEESSPTYSRLSGACTALISSGTSTFASGLLGISTDGTDAFFFTRDSLVPSDENGPTMKVYDARVEGGLPFVLPRADCKASDECHGASSPPPPPLQIGSESGTHHQFEPESKECRKGFAKKHGRCVKKVRHERHKGKHKHRAKHHRKGTVRP